MNPDENNQNGTGTDHDGGDGSTVAETQTKVDAIQTQLNELDDDSKSKILTPLRDEMVGSLKRQLKDAKQALEDAKKPVTPSVNSQTNQQPNEPDYARLAFLQSQQVVHPDDQKVILDEAARLKLPLTDILQMEHIKSKLTTQRDTRAAQDGMPSGTGRKGAVKGDVDYYLAHPDEVPEDLELHNKVIDAKLKKIEGANKFSDVPFIG